MVTYDNSQSFVDKKSKMQTTKTLNDFSPEQDDIEE